VRLRKNLSNYVNWITVRNSIAREKLTAYAVLLHTPDGTSAVAVVVCYCGDLAEGERVLKPPREFGTPVLDAIQPLPFPHMQSLLDGAFPTGNQNYWKSTFLRALSDEVIDLLTEHANRATSPLTAVVVEHYGGAASRVGISETAFAHREAQYNVGILAQWTDPAKSPRHIEWTRSPCRRPATLFQWRIPVELPG
jgi:hypothetical protein